jgi:hypothetical protein
MVENLKVEAVAVAADVMVAVDVEESSVGLLTIAIARLA